MSNQIKEQAPLKQYQMKLFVAGNDKNSREARRNLGKLCESRLQGMYELEIIDVLQDFKTALEHDVLVAPTLIITSSKSPGTKSQPLTIVGSLNDISKVCKAIGVTDMKETP